MVGDAGYSAGPSAWPTGSQADAMPGRWLPYRAASLAARIAEAEREGWTGEAEGLKISLAAAGAKLAEADAAAARQRTASDLGMPAYRDIAGRFTAGPAKP